MEQLKIKIKKLNPDAVIPKRATEGAVGYDLTAISMKETDTFIEYGTGLSIEPSKGYYTLIFPRSSISKYDLVLCNSLGLIDEDYRGELILRFRKINFAPRGSGFFGDFLTPNPNYYQIGDKIGQLVIQQKLVIDDFEIVEELNDTNRGTGGFGSTGK